MEKVTLRSACRRAGQRGLRRSTSVVGGHFGGQSSATIDRESCGANGLSAKSRCPGLCPGSGLSLRRVGWVVLAQAAPGAGEARMVWLSAKPDRLVELHWLSPLLNAVGSAGGICA